MLETDILTERALRRRRGELNGTCTEPARPQPLSAPPQAGLHGRSSKAALCGGLEEEPAMSVTPVLPAKNLSAFLSCHDVSKYGLASGVPCE